MTDFNLYDLSQGLALATPSVQLSFPPGSASNDITQNAVKNSVTLSVGVVQANGTSSSVAGAPYEDWYLFDVIFSVASNPGVVHNDDKHRGPYLKEVVFTAKPTSGYGDQVLLYEEAPATYEGQTSVTKGVTGSLGGNVGFFGDAPTGGLTGGVSFSKSVTTDEPDLTIADQSANQIPQWLYTVAGPSKSGPDDIDQTLSPMVQVSYNTLSLEMLWAWHVPQAARSGSDGLSILVSATCTYEYRWVDYSGAKTQTATCQTITWPVTVKFPPVQQAQQQQQASVQAAP